jgi:Holliday junction resolvasome RuvABC endonuclease subunit
VKTKTEDGDRRIVQVRDTVMPELADCHAVVIERAPAALKGYASEILQQLQGAIRAALMDAGIPYAIIPPSTLKKYATGNGTASKTEMAMAAFKRAGREFERDKGGDMCDAWWLRCAGLEHWGSGIYPAVQLPAAQTGALGAVVWPEPRTETAMETLMAAMPGPVSLDGFDPWA